MPKQSNMSQKIYKNVIKFAVCCLFTAEYGACPSMWFLYLIGSLGENQIFLSKHVLIVDSFWVRDCSLCSLPLSALGSHLVWICAGPVHGAICASVWLVIEDTFSLVLSISIDSYNISTSASA